MGVAITLPAQPNRPAFEIASVKVTPGNAMSDVTPRRSGNRIAMHNVRVATLIIYAYHLANGALTTSYQLAGNPQLLDGSDIFDIEAIAPGSPTDDDLRSMFQALLEDRFKLKYHWESREMPLYDLLIAKNGPRLKPSDPKRKLPIGPRPDPEPGVSRLRGSASIEILVTGLSARLDAPVRNLTGLTGGSYDFDVPYAREVGATTAAANLVTAVEEELGLKLRRSKGPVQVLVVDHVEKPAEN
jgi:uncharacterized protein (TIGR03435 family)